jgi:hypothetical protein
MTGQTKEERRMPLVRVDVNQGRTPEQLQAPSRGIHDAIVADVFIGGVENTAGDWSFGFGQAQYVTGELRVPSK